MKLKLDFDINENELVEGIKAEVRKATALTMEAAEQKARELARQRLGPHGLQHWERGFSSHKVTEDLYIITIEGKLASWMENGIQPGEISKTIMSGNRAQHNASEGKNYVDVPFLKDADASGNIKGTNLNVKAFASADDLVKNVKFSDFKNKSVREEKRVVSRIKDIIKSADPQGEKQTQFLTIRRVTQGSVWPKSPFKGANVLNELEEFIDQKFEEILGEVL